MGGHGVIVAIQILGEVLLKAGRDVPSVSIGLESCSENIPPRLNDRLKNE